MKNRLGLPLPFVEFALEADSKHDYEPHVYSVTELLNPIRKIALYRMHRDEIETDVSDAIPALFGTAVHAILEGKATGMRSEVPVSAEFKGFEVTGRIDLIDGDAIVDYKTCSASKVQKKDFLDWETQCKCYSYLLWKTTGELIRKFRVYAIIKDWSKVKAANSPDYPQSAVYVLERTIEDSDYDYIEGYLGAKGSLVEEALSTGILPLCADEERWKSPDKWAVYKRSTDKRAVCVCDSEEDACAAITERCGGSGIVQFRRGECVRCKHYCECAEWCEQGGKE